MLPRELRQYSNRKVFVALGAITGLAFIATAATTVALSALLVYRQGAQNYNDNRVELADLDARVHKTALLVREYALSRNQSNLEEYRQIVASLSQAVYNIEASSAPTITAQDLAKLRTIIGAITSEQDRIISLAQAGEVAAIDAALRTGAENNHVAQLTQLTNDIRAADVAQLAADRRRIDLLAVTARDISLGSLGLTLVLAVLVYYLYLKAIQSERRLDKAKDDFVSLASHQLRSPATGVKSILAMLVAGDVGPLNEQQLYFATKALQSNDRGLQVIEDLLNVAKADAGRLVLNPTSFDIVELVRAITTEQGPAIKAAGLEFILKLPQNAILVTADHDKLYMAIGNLVDNARKYTPRGGSVTVRLASRGRNVRIWVIDTGQGILAADLPHIFDRFGRGTTAQQRHVDGTGLGLYLVRAIAELHGGKIKVRSRHQKGSTFAMMIPKRRRHTL